MNRWDYLEFDLLVGATLALATLITLAAIGRFLGML